MADALENFERLLYCVGDERRWIQHSPILPNVWKAFFDNPGAAVDLLITPHRESRPAQLAAAIRERLPNAPIESKAGRKEQAFDRDIAYNQSTVVVAVTFDELILHLMPLSDWYEKTIAAHLGEVRKYARLTKASKKLRLLLQEIDEPELPPRQMNRTLTWWMRLIGAMSILQEPQGTSDQGRRKVARRAHRELPAAEAIWQRTQMYLAAVDKAPSADANGPRLFRIALNRPARTACSDSVRTVKADAARRVFDVNTSRICWAVLDSGVDARHEAFLDEKGNRRIKETYDFTRVRRLIALASSPGDAAEVEIKKTFGISVQEARRMRMALASGADVDWEALKPALRVEHTPGALADYAAQINPHGTHVAGILGGRPKERADGDGDFQGMCPDILLIDIRILDREGGAGAARGQREFDIIAALQFVGHLNAASDEPVVHGVNLSIQLQHDPEDFACGRTPVCEECNRLVANGVVVVAAAGNMGIDRESTIANTTEGAFRDISIADPGNAAAVITVGSTHRKRPHAYGVSFFSSRGPTGDGRQKPDLVAPGEKILGPVLDDAYDEMQGTSQAAPHVSGAAAMLLARHSELIGDPERVKQILCSTATDLGRERHFQGAGLVDVLRALQSI